MKIHQYKRGIAGQDSLDLTRAILSETRSILAMSRSQIEALQTSRLQEILTFAKAHAPWYEKRFKDIDTHNFELSNLSQLPMMNKRDLMDNWDGIVTDQSVKLDEASSFLMHETGYDLFHGHHLFASGGSSGRRGMFVWGADELATCLASVYRYQYRDEYQMASPYERFLVASVAATKPVHLSETVLALPVIPNMQSVALSALDPIDVLVKSLNDCQPTHLNGYPSVIARLALQAIKGRLNISPQRILVGAEPLLSNMIYSIKEAWPHVIINNNWGSTDAGIHAIACDYSNEFLHLNEDLVIVEPVDEHNRPVLAGQRSEKVLVTNLYRKSLPIFRYEMDDRILMIEEPCACGAKFKLIGAIDGRKEDDFIYDKVTVIAEVFENIIMLEPGIDEYQVFQTVKGADIFIVPERHFNIDKDKMKKALESQFKTLGIAEPSVQIHLVEQLKRHPETGKLKRFKCLVAE